MQPTPASTNDSTIAGPACWAAASPVSTKMPVPMMPPMPKAIRAGTPNARFKLLSEASFWYAAMGLVASIPFIFMFAPNVAD